MSTRAKRIKLARPQLLAPVRSTVTDQVTGKPRVNSVSKSGPVVVWVCPYCFNWRSTRKHIADCCAHHHERLLSLWGKCIEQGIIENPEKKYKGRHLPIRTLGNDEAHFIADDRGRYCLELSDGVRLNSAEARVLGRRDSENPNASLLRRALKVWPKGGRGRGE